MVCSRNKNATVFWRSLLIPDACFLIVEWVVNSGFATSSVLVDILGGVILSLRGEKGLRNSGGLRIEHDGAHDCCIGEQACCADNEQDQGCEQGAGPRRAQPLTAWRLLQWHGNLRDLCGRNYWHWWCRWCTDELHHLRWYWYADRRRNTFSGRAKLHIRRRFLICWRWHWRNNWLCWYLRTTRWAYIGSKQWRTAFAAIHFSVTPYLSQIRALLNTASPVLFAPVSLNTPSPTKPLSKLVSLTLCRNCPLE